MAASIHLRNLLKFLRFFTGSFHLPLLTHADTQNLNEPTISTLLGLTVIVPRDGTTDNSDLDYDVRGILGTGRLSDDYAVQRMGRDLPLANHLGNLYEALPPERLLRGALLEYFPAMSMVRNPCNMESFSYHPPYMNYVFLLTVKFDLTYDESMDVQSAMEFIHHSSIFFVAACECVLSSWERPRGSVGLRLGGFRLGYLIMRLMKVLFDEFMSQNVNK